MSNLFLKYFLSLIKNMYQFCLCYNLFVSIFKRNKRMLQVYINFYAKSLKYFFYISQNAFRPYITHKKHSSVLNYPTFPFLYKISESEIRPYNWLPGYFLFAFKGKRSKRVYLPFILHKRENRPYKKKNDNSVR